MHSHVEAGRWQRWGNRNKCKLSVAVGGMSNEEAKAKLEQNYGSYKLTIKERGGKTEEISPQREDRL
ncbi:MAG: hypothetical protein ACLR8P_03220 [Clostridium fessum]